MKKIYENHELYQLIDDIREYLKENPDAPPFFKGKVESNPYGQGGEQEIWFEVDEDGDLISTFPHEYDRDGTTYAWTYRWTAGTYKGSIEIIGFTELKPFEL